MLPCMGQQTLIQVQTAQIFLEINNVFVATLSRADALTSHQSSWPSSRDVKRSAVVSDPFFLTWLCSRPHIYEWAVTSAVRWVPKPLGGKPRRNVSCVSRRPAAASKMDCCGASDALCSYESISLVQRTLRRRELRAQLAPFKGIRSRAEGSKTKALRRADHLLLRRCATNPSLWRVCEEETQGRKSNIGF